MKDHTLIIMVVLVTCLLAFSRSISRPLCELGRRYEGLSILGCEGGCNETT